MSAAATDELPAQALALIVERPLMDYLRSVAAFHGVSEAAVVRYILRSFQSVNPKATDVAPIGRRGEL